ncbi:MAG: R3H domain-containing nucleic acid-binding protein [Candidatus Gottesmanbacteria bacterium]
MEPTIKIKDITEDLLKRLGIAGDVSIDTDESGAYRVNIETEETGLLIGFHGRTLESFQMMLGMIVAKELGSWERVYVNVGDYREKREEALMYMAQRASERAITTGRPVELSHLSAAERRVIHLTLSGDERVSTESAGEGRERKLVISPKVA